jgi:hypothetical protein
MWELIIGGGLTATGGALVTWLTNWLANRSERRRVERDRHMAQLTYVVEATGAGREWSASLSSVSLLLGTIKDVAALTEASGWIDFNEKTVRYRRALNTMDLSLSDPEMHAKGRELAAHVDKQTAVTAPIVLTTQSVGRATTEQMQALWAYCSEHEKLLDEFAEIARRQLYGEVGPAKAIPASQSSIEE